MMAMVNYSAPNMQQQYPSQSNFLYLTFTPADAPAPTPSSSLSHATTAALSVMLSVLGVVTIAGTAAVLLRRRRRAAQRSLRGDSDADGRAEVSDGWSLWGRLPEAKEVELASP